MLIVKNTVKIPGIVDQVRIAFSRNNRLATVIGGLLGAIVPLATFMVAHEELGATPWLNPMSLLVLGGLLYSARTVYQWGRLAFGSWAKALGFTVLLEGVMTCSAQPWLAITALVYLCAINAIATGVTLTRGVKIHAESTVETKAKGGRRMLRAV